MIYLITRKLGRALLTILFILTMVFVLLRSAGDPVSIFLGPEATPQMREAYAQKLGLNGPMLSQYASFLLEASSGNFGISYLHNKDALTVVFEHLPSTLLLAGTSFLLSVMVGIVSGGWAAVKAGGHFDRFLAVVTSLAFCIPNFFLAIILMLVFSIKLRIFPTVGSDGYHHLVLPSITMAAANAAVVARYTRSAVIEALNARCVTAARARNIPFRRILIHHVFPNAAIPLVTILGFMLGGLVSGSTVIETVFSWPGTGQLLITSVGNRDIPVVQAIVVLAGVSMVVANLLTDLLYGWLDPRTRQNSARE